MEYCLREDFTKPLIIPAPGGAKAQCAVIIWFHGFNTSGYDWYGAFLEKIQSPHIKVVLPHASRIPFAAQNGRLVRAWFDRPALGYKAPDNVESFENAVETAQDIIYEEIAKGMPSNRIVIGGSDMGGSLALYAGLTFESPLGGIFCLNSYLMRRDQLLKDLNPANEITPVLFLHGENNTVVPAQYSKDSQLFLQDHCRTNVERRTYATKHCLCLNATIDLKAWLCRCIPPPPKSLRRRRHRRTQTFINAVTTRH